LTDSSCDDYLLADFKGRVQQFPQANIFRFQRSELLHLRILHEDLGAQAFIFFLQVAPGGQRFAEPLGNGVGYIHQQLDGVNHHRQAGTH